MNKKLAQTLTIIFGAFFAVAALIYVLAHGFAAPEKIAHAHVEHPKKMEWSFDGITGTFDKQSVQRGYKVYKEVCASCHGMNLISYRNLAGAGFSEGEIKAIAAEYSYPEIAEDGSVKDRKGIPSDRFKEPYENKHAAAAANGGAVPPDLSLMIKARPDGANYVYSLLTGYHDAPEGVQIPAGKYYNPYFPGQVISMPKPINDGQVEFEDGTKATIEQQAHDVVNFLQYTAEPEMELRKRMGLKVVIFLSILSVFFYFAKVRVWARVE